MKRRTFESVAALLVTAACLALVGTAARATTVTYEATDLADTTSGEDLWQYSYRVSGFPAAAFTGFSVFFLPDDFTLIEDPAAAPNADWDVRTFQPVPAIPAEGYYDAVALADSASLADPFTVKFVWLGGAARAPGAQPFEVYATDADFLSYEPLSESTTRAAGTNTVPEPGTLGLAATGLAVLARLSRRQRRDS